MLKNTLLYYLLILLPVLALVYLGKAAGSTFFVISLFGYLLLYRPLIDRARLLAKGVITRKEARQFYFWGLTTKYFKELYLP
jgi:hypothetical protein